MIRAEQQLATALAADAGVIALIGARVYPDGAPIATPDAPVSTPYVVFERRSTDPQTTIHDEAPVANRVTVAATAWAKSRLSAESVGDAIEAALHDVGLPVGRLGEFNPETRLYAAVIDVEIWET